MNDPRTNRVSAALLLGAFACVSCTGYLSGGEAGAEEEQLLDAGAPPVTSDRDLGLRLSPDAAPAPDLDRPDAIPSPDLPPKPKPDTHPAPKPDTLPGGSVCGTFKPSGVKSSKLGYKYIWYKTCVVNKCPMCGATSALVYGRAGMEWMGDLCKNKGYAHPASWGGYWTYEGAYWCCKCDADYCGVTGYEHTYSPTHPLTFSYGPQPVSGP